MPDKKKIETLNKRVQQLTRDLQKCIKDKDHMRLKALTFMHTHAAVFITDFNGTIIDWNPSSKDVFGYKDDEIIGLTPEILFGAEEYESIKDIIAKSSNKDFYWTGELGFVTKEGNSGIGETQVVPLIDENNRKQAVAIVTREITEKKQAEIVLGESEEQFRDLFENSTDLIQSVDKDGQFIQVNKRWKKTLGYSDKEISNLSIWDIIHPDSLKSCKQIFKRVFSGETAYNVETAFISKKGKEIIVEGNANPRYKDDKIIATRGFFRDITKRKEAEEELLKAHEETKEANKKLAAAYAEMKDRKDKATSQLREAELVFFIDFNGLIKGISDSILEITDLNRTEILDRNINELIDKKSANTLSEDIKKVYRGLSKEISVRFRRKQFYTYAFEGKLTRIGLKTEKMFLLLLRETS